MQRYDRPPFHDDSAQAIKEGYRDLGLDFLLGNLDLESLPVVFQRAIPSMKVTDPDTGNKYPACARVIVQNGEAVRAFWRSSMKDEGSLTERLRHNMTNGAGIMPVSPEQDSLLREIAEAAVYEFEKTNRDVQEVQVDNSEDPLRALQDMFYGDRIKTAAAHYGVDVASEVSNWLRQANSSLNQPLESKVKKLLS